MKALPRIKKDNLKPLVETLLAFVDYRFDDWDWDAIFYGVRDSNDEEDRWYEYELIGDRKFKLHLARDAESDLIFVLVEADEALEEKASVAAEIMQTYYLYDEPRKRALYP